MRRIVEALKAFDNLYYEICNEPYFGGVTQGFQRRIAEVIADTEKDFPYRHLISMNVANGREGVRIPARWFPSSISTTAIRRMWSRSTTAPTRLPAGTRPVSAARRMSCTAPRAGTISSPAGASTTTWIIRSRRSTRTARSWIIKSPGGGSPALREQLSILENFPRGLRLDSPGPHYTSSGAACPGR